ncbi:hypothetical protein [Rubinisphaera margarita]|uniref:hypothetical protein n=1 Tax=Rubinisphaera margarita TaxID=2909586 RepID=UPI001EE78A44|nr:hypothetical protein [Rubinisphaera margarita]MCG6156843.1 hypothetical protein [Rubinisphaera margarita]
MNWNNVDIESIVGNVLAELQQRGHTVSTAVPSVPQNEQKRNQSPLLTDRVITADLLAQNVQPAATISIPAGSIITPAARDYLREKKIQIQQRQPAGTTKAAPAAMKWRGLIVTAGDTLKSSLANLEKNTNIGWSQESSDSTEAAAETAKHELARGGAHGFVICTDRVATACCLVNRSESVRGVAINSVKDIPAIAELKANVICLPCNGLSFIDYRTIFRALASH